MPYKDPAKIKRYQAAYRRKHRAALNAYGRRYNKTHAKRNVLRAKKWRRENREAFNRRSRLYTRRKRARLLREQLALQNNLCGLCKKPFTKRNPPVRDHDHKTGKWRDLLHNKCNCAIGLLDESPEHCQQAAAYLRKWKN